MIFIVIGDRNTDAQVAAAVATALCAAGITDAFSGGAPYRVSQESGGLIELLCDSSEFLRAKAAFVANGFSVLGTSPQSS
jgi:hypothetical protein